MNIEAIKRLIMEKVEIKLEDLKEKCSNQRKLSMARDANRIPDN